MNRLAYFRKLKAISRYALADTHAVDVSDRHIAFLERGERNPPIALAYKIANSWIIEKIPWQVRPGGRPKL